MTLESCPKSSASCPISWTLAHKPLFYVVYEKEFASKVCIVVRVYFSLILNAVNTWNLPPGYASGRAEWRLQDTEF